MERLTIDIKPSGTFCILCSTAHLVALGALWFATIPGLLAAGLALALTASLAFYLRRFGLLADGASVTALTWRTSGWWLGLADGRWLPATMKDRLIATRYLVVMHLETEEGRCYPVALLPDSTTAEEFRRLKVFLRLMPADAGVNRR